MNWLAINLERFGITQQELSSMTSISQSRISRLVQSRDDEELLSKMYAREKIALKELFEELDSI
jgi:transcriptional regulator with XRE-family HTH domain